jgi:hypothetical protein
MAGTGLAIGLVWLVAILTTVVTWVVASHRLSTRAMRRLGRPEVPTTEWLAKVLTLFSYLGTTRRPLRVLAAEAPRNAVSVEISPISHPSRNARSTGDLAHDADSAAFPGHLRLIASPRSAAVDFRSRRQRQEHLPSYASLVGAGHKRRGRFPHRRRLALSRA